MTTQQIPVITLDGPAASGKGTIAERLASALGFHYLDSGALYRIATYAALRDKVALDDEGALTQLTKSLAPRFVDGRVFLNNEDITTAIRSEEVSAASRVDGFTSQGRPTSWISRRWTRYGNSDFPSGYIESLYDCFGSRSGRAPLQATDCSR